MIVRMVRLSVIIDCKNAGWEGHKWWFGRPSVVMYKVGLEVRHEQVAYTSKSEYCTSNTAGNHAVSLHVCGFRSSL